MNDNEANRLKGISVIPTLDVALSASQREGDQSCIPWRKKNLISCFVPAKFYRTQATSGSNTMRTSLLT